jgi:pyruvyltransferase
MLNFYWWEIPQNFGDMLTPVILDHFGVKYTKAIKPEEANAYCVGSIARLANPNSLVIGSGIIKKHEKLDPSVNWRAVRGPRTRDKVLECGGTCPKIYGDPALLLPLIKPLTNPPKYRIGIVPHYQDYAKIKQKYGDSIYHVIDVVNPNPLVVLDEILSCGKIISSSLHGIIVAQAYDIPASWFAISKLHGDGSKFEDYFASRNIMDAEISSIEDPKYMDGGAINLEPLIEQFEILAEETNAGIQVLTR